MKIDKITNILPDIALRKYDVGDTYSVYLICDETNDVIYIGSTKRLSTRIHCHAGWIPGISSVYYLQTTKDKYHTIEVSLIRKFKPKFNKLFVDDDILPIPYVTKNRKKLRKIDTDKIISEMKRQGYSQNTFAPHIGKTRQAVGYILKKGSTTFRTLGEIAEALGVDAKDLLV